MIEARGLTKRFGDKLAVDQLTFTVEPGRITGFLGPNGAGKTTTMRMILGLDRPTVVATLAPGRPLGNPEVSVAVRRRVQRGGHRSGIARIAVHTEVVELAHQRRVGEH